MYERGTCAIIAKQVGINNLQMLGICESRWTQSEEVSLETWRIRETALYPSHETNNYASHIGGVAFTINGKAKQGYWYQNVGPCTIVVFH